MILRSPLPFLRFRFTPLLLSCLFLVGCGSTSWPLQDLESQFARAEEDAATAEPAEVVTDLPPLVRGQSGLVWDEAGRVLVTLWTPRAGSWGKTAASFPLDTEVWVNPAPALENFCRRLFRAPKEEVRLRLEQLLGLPPGAGEGRDVVEFWVEPEALFRPCADPAVDDDHCDLHAPLGEEHRAWYERQEERGRAPDGALWTRLGVTYDWGSPYSEAGLPVWVVPAGNRIEVARVAATKDYCVRP